MDAFQRPRKGRETLPGAAQRSACGGGPLESSYLAAKSMENEGKRWKKEEKGWKKRMERRCKVAEAPRRADGARRLQTAGLVTERRERPKGSDV